MLHRDRPHTAIDDASQTATSSDRHGLADASRCCKSSIHPLPCLLVACVAVVTNEHIFNVEYINHPFTILLLHALGALLFHLSVILWSKSQCYLLEASTTSPDQDERQPWTIWTVIRVLSVAAALVCGYLGMSFLHNPVCLVMVLSIPLRSGLSLEQAMRKLDRNLAARVIILVVCILFMFRYDYRLSSQGILCILGAAVSAELAKFASDKSATDDSIQNNHGIPPDISIPLFASLVLVLAILYPFSDPEKADFVFQRAPLLLTINILAGASTLLFASDVFTPSQPSTPGHGKLSTAAVVSTPIFVGIVSIAYNFFGRETLVSPVQIAAFFVSWLSIATTGEDQCWTSMQHDSSHIAAAPLDKTSLLEAHVDELIELVDSAQTSVDGDDDERSPLQRMRGRRWPVNLCWTSIILAGSIAWLLLTLQSLGLRLTWTSPTHSPNLDRDFRATRALDIVVAYHNEPFDDLMSSLRPLLSVSAVASLSPRIVLYDKGNSSSHPDTFRNRVAAGLRNTTDVVAIGRPNVGRESETYLHHVLEQWDDLANHTLFTQAAMHDPIQASRRLRDYLAPATGFLSLSYSDTLCRDCDACHDAWRWAEPAPFLTDLHAHANNNNNNNNNGTADTAGPCRDLALTYKGQFVASAPRIRGGNHTLYRELHTALVDPDSARHAPAYLDSVPYGERDRVDNPVFGYTLERMWGVVMQCSGARVADRCPSLLSGLLGVAGSLEDCQCLDD